MQEALRSVPSTRAGAGEGKNWNWASALTPSKFNIKLYAYGEPEAVFLSKVEHKIVLLSS